MSWTSRLLSFSRDERVILLTISLATFGLVSSMITALTFIRDDNEIPPSEPKTQYITQDTEDSLQLDTLEKLLDHPNFSIKEIAIKILCDRAANDPEVIKYIWFGITRPEYEERMNSLRTLAVLTSQTGNEGLARLHDERAYSALVRCMELCMESTDLPIVTDIHWDEYYLRDMGERFCLMFLTELINKYGATMLVKAKFVEKWLSKQDWGSTGEERRRNFKDYTDLRNNRITDIINRIKHSRRGLRALEKAGLIDKESSRRRMRELPDLLMEVEEEIVGEQAGEQQSRRTREHSAEEQRLRRQHREAMVLNDGTRPLGREDIIERDASPS
ncbi:uncharacterized protein TrAtP1_004221 [Trichoderma atroviride]|uniref:Cytoskeleton-associated protein n=1 Tax=Hypocrea atroviridis (strain ATCC 20476 / IMI 206040) TaxID=452589 RepID=G9P7V5_HYPAI|nr:uncharacterized protein TRIATDRAFT_78345 [Trichoderma atroviride IMI 206040]EHK40858.1 hypothetical protein TRIATDRAFT_78345 [Trichoderma atroviride IMI 206040]UKZ62992.1 hypothetical protein TrAtP1_004221 [Trichoderma atroviride]